MTTKREQILERVGTVLTGTGYLSEVTVERTVPIDLDTAVFPAAFVYGGDETRVHDGTMGYETWDWDVTIELWVEGGNIEDYLGYIHNAMYADHTLNGLALYSYRTGVKKLTIDPEKNLEVMLIEFLVRYRHSAGTM